MDKTERREWINTIVAIGGLVVSIIGLIFLIYGATQLHDVNINLQNLTSDKLSTYYLQILSPNGTEAGYIYDNGSATIIGRK